MTNKSSGTYRAIGKAAFVEELINSSLPVKLQMPITHLRRWTSHTSPSQAHRHHLVFLAYRPHRPPACANDPVLRGRVLQNFYIYGQELPAIWPVVLA